MTESPNTAAEKSEDLARAWNDTNAKIQRLANMNSDDLGFQISRLNGSIVSVVEVSKSEDGTSVQDDDAGRTVGVNGLITPKYDPNKLRMLLEGSSELGQVIAAMVANTVGYGYRLLRRADKDPKTTNETLDTERLEVENFFAYANSRESFIQVLEIAAWDYFSTGNMYLEITRNAKGKPDGITRIPAYQMRCTAPEKTQVRVAMKQIRRTTDGYTLNNKFERLAFRRYAQDPSLSGGTTFNKVWFKEFQDPRAYNRETGELVTDRAEIADLKRTGKLANEVIHIAAPLRRGPYGLPAFIGNMTSIRGDMAAELVNVTTLENNNIPSMFVLVSNGRLNTDSVKRIGQFVETQIQGNANRSRFVVLESEHVDDDEPTGHSRLQIEPLVNVQRDDAMFQKYTDENRAAIRRSFRIPEILVGRGASISGASTAAAMKLADEQVFSQERQRFVDWVNQRLMPELGIANWVFALNSPNATDPMTLVNVLTTAEKTGGMSPEISRMILEIILGTELPEFPDGFDPKIPFTITVAEAVKRVNDSGANNPSGSQQPRDVMNKADQTEPTQQVTTTLVKALIEGQLGISSNGT